MDMQILYIVAAALVRSILGWLKHSLSDGKIEDFEWKKLGETIVRVGFIGAIVAYFPGIDVSWFEAAIVALGADLVLNIKNKIVKKK